MSEESLFIEDSAEEESFRASKSFAQYRETESIVIGETDSEAEAGTEENASAQSSGVMTEEESMVRQLKKRQSMRMSLHPRQADSESEEENERDRDTVRMDDGESDEEVERQAFTPLNRRSILGAASSESSDEEARADDDSSSEDEIIIAPRKIRKKIVISDDEEQDTNSSGAPPQNGSFDASLPLRSFNAEEVKPVDGSVDRDTINTKLSSTLKSMEGEDEEEREEHQAVDLTQGELSFAAGRNSISMRASLADKLSSTHIGQVVPEADVDPLAVSNAKSNSSTTNSDSSSVRLIEKSAEILSVSSSDDEDVTFQGEMQTPARKPSSLPSSQQNLVQPTITAFVRTHTERVSQSEYDAKVYKMADLKSQLVLLESMLKNGAKLPDKGAALVRRLADVKAQIFELAKVIEMTRATPSKGAKNVIRENFDRSEENSRQSGNVLSWDVIKKATDEIQPRHTGKQGIATFENQKLLTMDRLATLHKSIETCPSEDTLADPPKLLRIELMDHQRHALAWMLWRESQKPRGGILADDMGLGKTLSMISLILRAAELDPEGEQLGRDSESEDDEDEENRHPSETKHGWKGKGRKDFYAGGTLIVCPASLMRQWEGEITNRVKRNSLAVCVHHGTQRETKPRHLAKYDVVITTYNIVSRESKDAARGGVGVYGVNWERIILDEAHVIRNHKSAMSEACCGLKGRCRWLLTGTPIQNKEMDVYALMKFLRCTPFNDLGHWKRWIDNKTAGGAMRLNTIMKSIMLRRTKKQLQDRGALNSLPDKTIETIEVVLSKDEMNVYQKVLMYSKHLFAQFLHQRAEKEQANGYGGHYHHHGGRPTFAQTRAPNNAFEKVHRKLKSMHNGDEAMEVKQHQILLLLLRLRQICCHPGLIHAMLDDDDGGNLELSGAEDAGASFDAEVDLLGQLNKLKLGDVLAEQETKAANGGGDVSLNLSEEFDRPEAMAKVLAKVMLRSNPVFQLNRPSSKIETVMAMLEEKIFGTDDKAIIVSQWTSVLDILGSHLTARNVAYVSLTGQVPVKFRNDIVVDFNKPSGSAKIMLLSLTAGGVGLNLVGANHLFLLDPHWNPQLEAQAQDRIYRVGQKKSVFIWKFMCTDTVEQKIQALQQHKLGIADGVLTGTVNKGSKLTIDDLKSLFGL
uniref:Transcription termination factor 2 n=1 Tax=Anopheles farauti TaxID=69004 RepID=A0A499FUU0_9DIPT